MTMMRLPLRMVAIALLAAAPLSAHAQDRAPATETWLPTLVTSTPQEGFELAVMLARKGVTTTQTDREILKTLRPAYARDADSLTAASQVIALHFQTIAAANDYWRSE